jgi:16S rRNA G966 N2-methylase RsmD
VAPVERFLRGDRRVWDVIFLDPPFDAEGKGAVLDDACRPVHLSPGGVAIIHLHRAENLETDRPGLELADRRVYGQSILLFFRRREGSA